mgnify:CR=1 FL=1
MRFYADRDPHVCNRCGGPALMFRGTEHGWKCGRCLNEYLARQIERADERPGLNKRRAMAPVGVPR